LQRQNVERLQNWHVGYYTINIADAAAFLARLLCMRWGGMGSTFVVLTAITAVALHGGGAGLLRRAVPSLLPRHYQ
jgi:hypothetical protein